MAPLVLLSHRRHAIVWSAAIAGATLLLILWRVGQPVGSDGSSVLLALGLALGLLAAVLYFARNRKRSATGTTLPAAAAEREHAGGCDDGPKGPGRRGADAALRESEEIFRSIFENASVGMARMDPTGRFILANKAYLEMVGYSMDELKDLTVHQITHPEDRARNELLFGRLIRKEIPSFEIQKRYARKDGRDLWVNKSVSVVLDTDGRVLYVQSIIQDITERRRDRLELEKREHLLREAQEIASMGAWEWDLQTDTVEWSDAMFDLFGLSPASPPPNYGKFLDLIHPEDRPAVEDAVKRTIEEGKETETVFRILRADGSTRWLQGRRRIVRDRDENNSGRMTGTTQDITELKEAEQAVRLLARAGMAFGRALDYRATFAEVAGLVVPELADICVFHLLVAGGGIQRFAFRHRNPALQTAIEESIPSVLAPEGVNNPAVRAIRTGEAVFVPVVDEEWLRSLAPGEQQMDALRMIDPLSVLVLPVGVGERTLGALSFIRTKESGRRFDRRELPFFEELARRAAIALENARLHEGLRDRETQLSEAQEIAHVGNWTWDIDHNRVTWSPELYRIYGYDPDAFEVDYETFLSLVLPGDRNRVDETVRRCFSTGEPFDFHHGVVRPDGEVRLLHARGRVVRDADGRVTRMLGTGQDVTDTVRAQRALRQSEESYRQLAENVGEMIVRFSPEGRVTYASQATRTILGYEPDEVLGREGADFLHPEDLARVAEAHRGLLHGEDSSPMLCRLMRRDGLPVWVETTTRAIRDGDTVAAIVTVSRDVTESVSAARNTRLLQRVAVLANESESVRDAMQTALELVCWHAGWPVGHVYMPSEDASGELTPTDIWHLDDPALHERFRAVTRSIVLLSGQGLPGRVLESGKAEWVRDIRADPGFIRATLARDLGVCSALAFPVHAADETIAVLEFFATEPQEPDAEMIELMEGVGSQLGEVLRRKRVENALKASEEKFRALAETATDAIVTIDESDRIIQCNESLERIFGYPCEEMIGTSITELMPEQPGVPGSGFRRLLEWVTAGGQAVETVGRRKNGELFPIEVSLSEWKTHEGTFITGILRDITARRRAEEALEEKVKELARSNAELALFTYIASHDLREPLRTVGSNLQLLRRHLGEELDTDARTQFDFALGGVRRMQALIDDLLLYSRVGTEGKAFADVDSREVADEAVQALTAAIQEAGVEVRVGGLPVVRADRTQLVQLFQNLISNAVKFRTDDSPRVEVVAERGVGEWIFTVRDNGIGIDARYADHVFTIFQRLHSQEEYPGTGIGLAVCRKIVERHGGRIWVESGRGGGSAFRFTIPARRR
ncbi:MAG TPA: PAS domain S-box protein [Gemmatimonadota bacterium]|nr:PAS domain S-box protein [Gemmatimonadota bacterium]